MSLDVTPTVPSAVPEEQPLLVTGPSGDTLYSQRMSMNLRREWMHKAHPYWLIPVVLVASISRGMTMALRIEVYFDIACGKIGSGRPVLEGCELKSLSSTAGEGEAAAIQAYLTTTMSVLSMITTGPWSRAGDFRGRKLAFLISISGALVLELAFMLVTTKNSVFSSYPEAILILGSLLDGLSGGISVFNGTVHAYSSDCTMHGSRSKIFSALQGLVSIGLALGPWLGNLIIKRSNSGSYRLFTISTIMLTLLLGFIVLLLPESLVPSPRSTSQAANTSASQMRSRKYSLLTMKSKFISLCRGLVAPLVIFVPRRTNQRSRKDYNVTFVGLAIFIYSIASGVYPVKYIYAKRTYSWTEIELGRYMSLLWILRAINLLVLLPMIITCLKPRSTGSNASEMSFDKKLAGWSLFVDGTADVLVAIMPSASEIGFIVFSSLSSFTSGGNPAMHSLGAVCMHAAGRSSEVGSLFGAMAFLSAVAHVISPTTFASTYASTSSHFPKAIFWLAAALLLSTVLLIALVRTESTYNVLPADDSGDVEEVDGTLPSDSGFEA